MKENREPTTGNLYNKGPLIHLVLIPLSFTRSPPALSGWALELISARSLEATVEAQREKHARRVIGAP